MRGDTIIGAATARAEAVSAMNSLRLVFIMSFSMSSFGAVSERDDAPVMRFFAH
jgi:hypothetical protein